MRLAPVPLFYANNRDEMLHFCAESSRTTHGAAECVDACQLLGAILWKGLLGGSKETMLAEHGFRPKTPAIVAIANGTYRNKSIDQIQGSGYVVKSLEAALWCFDQTDSFETAILAATNLGDDADTTAAITGQIAGAFYGENGIPKTWRSKLAQHALIKSVALQLMPEPLRS
jgi:ADP-ribosyl-[dinitrogen reductase] hydrolase